MGKQNNLDHSVRGFHLIDNFSGNVIRRTNNGLRDCDLEASQVNKPLKLDKNGVPVGWKPPKGD